MPTILVTGITGTIMRPLTLLLLSRGYTIVALVRSKGNDSAEDRLDALGFGKYLKSKRLFALAGDLRKCQAGVALEDQIFWGHKIDSILHGAASINFKEKNGDREIYDTNVEGTKQMLALARILEIPRIDYVATAYAAGDAHVCFEGPISPLHITRNDYEDTKRQAEEFIRSYEGAQTSIMRIPIVVGDSETGEIASFTGYYGFFKAFWKLRNRLLGAWTKDRATCIAAGIEVDTKEVISIPLSIPCCGPLNLVPIDWTIEIMANLIGVPAEGKTYNITNPHPPTVKYTIEESLDLMKFRVGEDGIVVGPSANGGKKATGATKSAQRFVDSGIEIYKPYINTLNQSFDDVVLRETLSAYGKPYVSPPDYDRAMYNRLIQFAIANNFGIED